MIQPRKTVFDAALFILLAIGNALALPLWWCLFVTPCVTIYKRGPYACQRWFRLTPRDLAGNRYPARRRVHL